MRASTIQPFILIVLLAGCAAREHTEASDIETTTEVVQGAGAGDPNTFHGSDEEASSTPSQSDQVDTLVPAADGGRPIRQRRAPVAIAASRAGCGAGAYVRFASRAAMLSWIRVIAAVGTV